MFLEISQNSQENTCARVSFLIKLQASARNFIKKETLAQMFSSEFCKISKNTLFHRTPLVAASVYSPERKIQPRIHHSFSTTIHPPLFFNNSEIKLNSNQKHLGLSLDSKLSFNEHINDNSSGKQKCRSPSKIVNNCHVPAYL